MKIIGLSGTFAAGKDTLADYLSNKHGFLHVSTSDIVRHVAQEQRGDTHRSVLFEVANQLRDERGGGVLVEMAIEESQQTEQEHDGLVISGIRSIGEVESLHQANGEMIFVDADQRIRYERAYSRKRSGEDSLSFEEFIETEKKELEKPMHNKTDQNIAGVKELSDHILDNSDTVQELTDSFDELGIL